MSGDMMVQKSLLTKLMAWLTFAMIAISVLVSVVNYQVASSKLQSNFESDKQAMIELTNSAIKEAVFAYDFDQVQAIAKSLVNTDLITGITVVDHVKLPHELNLVHGKMWRILPEKIHKEKSQQHSCPGGQIQPVKQANIIFGDPVADFYRD